MLGQVTQYQYDEAGNQIAQIDALGRTNTYFYDGQGRRIGHTMPGGQSEEFAYDADGNQIYHTDFDGTVVTNLYDVNNRLTNISSVFGYNVSFAYSATGQRTNMIDPSGQTAYTYNLRDWLLQKTVDWNGGTKVSLNYAYDANGNVTNIASTTPNGVNLTYSYDPLNRLTNVLDNGNPIAGYAYDWVGNLQALHYGNGVTNQYQYDSLNRLTNLTWNLNFSTLAKFSYTLGATGNRTNLSENVNGTSRSYQWQYDSLYRLTNEAIGITEPGRLIYQYDSVGNRTNRQSTISQLPATSYTYNTNDWLTSDQYDLNGNTTNSSGNSYQYDVMNHVTNAVVSGHQILMTYDGDGNRVSKTIGGTTTYYLVDDANPSGYSQVLEEWTVTSVATNLSKVYNYGSTLISQREPGTSTNYFIWDGHGSTRMLTENGGSVVNVLAYDAYGNLIASNGVLQTAYLYSGQQFDSDLQLYVNRARYLNTGTGRFWTADSTEGNNEDPLSLHKYLYAADDPEDNIDPLGLYSEDEGKAMERLIFADYTGAHPMDDVPPGGKQAGIGKNPLLKPDILNKTKKTFAEIKPLSLGGITKGVKQLRTYADSLGGLGYKRDLWPLNSIAPVRMVFYNWYPYFYFNVDGLILYTRIDPGTAVLPVSIPAARKLAAQQAVKLAAGEATTLEEAIAPEVGLVGVAEGADVGVGVGAAALTTGL